ncbi:unnamed protein product [Ceutorhynchus assimilis]|uniref:CCHC-type domain-containing protein n=1 Tax=Ceutorhynchus assimilis TaxID=467358 RepID=A0A9N9Q8I3_9CUCU|nr:unnamed protein product [Ceutorhynchus assimilis]
MPRPYLVLVDLFNWSQRKLDVPVAMRKDTLTANCPKPKREKGACFNCGSKQHLRNLCPQRTSATPASTTMVIRIIYKRWDS